MSRLSRAKRYMPASTLARLSPIQKPEVRAIVETDEAGGKVIRLSDGFPVRRSSYGRIRLEQRSRGKSE